MFNVFFRVGGKDQGTRFLSYVDAIAGFRHVLKQEDLDRALSMCTGLKGQLRSKFIVLSDDRVLPPYQGKSGKRQHPGDDQVSGKRPHQESTGSATPATGANAVPTFSGVVSGIRPLQASTVAQAAGASANPPVSGIVQINPVPSGSGLNLVPHPPVNIAVKKQPGFTVVKGSRQRGKKKKVVVDEEATPTRHTPSRQVKAVQVVHQGEKSKSVPMDITSPTEAAEQYQSCDEESGEEEQDTVGND